MSRNTLDIICCYLHIHVVCNSLLLLWRMAIYNQFYTEEKGVCT